MAEKMRWRKDPIAFPERRMKKLQEDVKVKEMHRLLTFIIELLTFTFSYSIHRREEELERVVVDGTFSLRCRPVSTVLGVEFLRVLGEYSLLWWFGR